MARTTLCHQDDIRTDEQLWMCDRYSSYLVAAAYKQMKSTTKQQLCAKLISEMMPKLTMNFTSLLVVIVFEIPRTCTISWKKKCAIEVESYVFLQAIKCTVFENLSTTTNIESWPIIVHDNPNMKSMDKSNKIFSRISNGMYNHVFYRCPLPSWQIWHLCTILSTSLFNCGQ